MMNCGLSNDTVGEIRRVLSRFPAVEKAILYGSRAQGTYRNGSDIDLALTGRELDDQTRSQIATELDEGPLPYRVDLLILSEVRHPALREDIERAGVILYQREIIAAN